MTDLEKGMKAFNDEDYKTAYNILKPLAEQGEAKAEFAMGLLFETGQGVPQNYKIAKKWYERAYKQGDGLTQFKTGEIHYLGLMGFEKNFEVALACFNKAALQGSAGAQFSLGVLYERGHGVDVNPIEAHKWYNIALANGYKGALTTRDAIAKNMTHEDITEAQELALDWFEKNPKPTS